MLQFIEKLSDMFRSPLNLPQCLVDKVCCRPDAVQLHDLTWANATCNAQMRPTQELDMRSAILSALPEGSRSWAMGFASTLSLFGCLR